MLGCGHNPQRLQADRSRPVDSRALYYSAKLDGRAGNWVDGPALQRSRQTKWDENHHLAKVRVAGSNSVFRSILAGRRHFSVLKFRVLAISSHEPSSNPTTASKFHTSGMSALS
jgi:hypothetical protein